MNMIRQHAPHFDVLYLCLWYHLYNTYTTCVIIHNSGEGGLVYRYSLIDYT